MDINTNLTAIKGIGEKTAGLFSKLHIGTVGQLLEHYPRDYERMEPAVTVSSLSPGKVCAVKASVIGMPSTKRVRNLLITAVQAGDATGLFRITFFGMPYLKNMLKPGMTYVFRGVCQYGTPLRMEQPRLFRVEEYTALQNTLQPRYALTQGLTNNGVSKAVRKALDSVLSEGNRLEILPEEIRNEFQLIPLGEALEKIHFPENTQDLIAARRRLAFDEFLLFFLALRKVKEENQIRKVDELLEKVPDTDRLLDSLPYRLTGAQQRVWSEIEADLQKENAMNRLVQGDVGSGKTILAFLALLMCAANGRQGCLMAPTEVLARQHYEALLQMSGEYDLCIRPVLLTGSQTAKEKREIYARIADGDANVVIGTHALIQEKVIYRRLSLVITDEQHRFGVRQRELLADKGKGTHVLVMSATPIPRTLAIVVYGDLHVSVLDEMPAGRKPIKNCVVNTSYRQTAYSFIRKQAEEGHQVYVICPMVEEGEMDGLENVMDYTDKLKAVLPDSIRVAALHGKMKPAEKNNIMEAFSNKEIDVLVSTTVIEVGINVPNATVMMVENAERFGLAQLHQLRGRVGRGDSQSYCIFISGNDNEQTMKRLNILNTSNDGFHIANEDLKLRGPGDLFGIRQSGLLDFKVGDIYQDSDLLLIASSLAERIAVQDPDEKLEQYSLLNERMKQDGNSIDFKTI